MPNNPPPTLLLAEDHPRDVDLTRKALAAVGIPHRLDVCIDGWDAQQYLLQQGRWVQAPRPHLVMLDLNMPRRTGFDVLHDIRSNPVLRCLPVVVLTTSSSQRDVQAAYEAGANAYLTKPLKQVDFQAQIAALMNFWFGHVLLP